MNRGFLCDGLSLVWLVSRIVPLIFVKFPCWGGEGRRRVQVELDGEAVDRQSHWNVFAPYHAGSKESRDSLGLDNDLDE